MHRVFLAITLLLLYLAYPFWTLQRIETALRARDTATLDALIDWPKVRTHVKTEVLRHLMKKIREDGSDASIGGALGTFLGTALVERMIDIQLSSAAMTDKAVQRFEKHTLDDILADTRFITPTAMHVDLRFPERPDTPVTIVLELDSLTWRVTRVSLPLEAVMDAVRVDGKSILDGLQPRRQ